MSYQPEFEVDNIAPMEKDSAGFVDVTFHIRNPEAFTDKAGVVQLRMFFTDPTIPFDQLVREARPASVDVLRRLVALLEAEAIPEDLRQRWK